MIVSIPSFPQYFASDTGEIIGPRGKLSQFSRKGYLRVQIGGFQRLVSRLVCEAFHGSAPTERHHAAHLDGNRSRNVPNNLQWKTPKENAKDLADHGSLKGENHGRAKLSQNDVKRILALREQGVSLKIIHTQFPGVCYATISHIANRRNWAHV